MTQSNFPVLTKEAAEKTARSIFVGNIPYEATEEKLIELFSKVSQHYTFGSRYRLGLSSVSV